MNLNHLRIFFESAKQLNFTKAAERLCISQPAVSVQIKQLEKALHVKLFYKVGNKIYLSGAGKSLLSYAQKIFELEDEAEKTINEIKEVKKGMLHIGTTKTYARYLMPSRISHFHALYPGVSIHLSEGSSLEMMQSLFNMQNELAIVASTEYPKPLQSITFGREEILLVTSPDHLLAKKDSISIKELANFPIIMREEGSATRKVIMDMFKRMHLSPTVLYEASNLEFIKELLEKGEGASFIVRAAVEKELLHGILKEVMISDVSLVMDTNIVYLDEGALTKIAHTFIDMLLMWDDT
ncbi:MAG: LysR substrate-binding domain-containing protein [Proteobacteria bacterium]|nr:LysR substrate-binding domain-containing protein [Pseudomonadota bacterium]